MTVDENAVAAISDVYDVPQNAARALLLAQRGYSHSGIAAELDLTEGTVKSYYGRLPDPLWTVKRRI